MNQTLQTGCDSNPCELLKYYKNIENSTSLGVKLPTHANRTTNVPDNKGKPSQGAHRERTGL